MAITGITGTGGAEADIAKMPFASSRLQILSVRGHNLRVEKLYFFWFILMQSSLNGFGLLAAGMTCLVVLLPDRQQLARLLWLPAIWLLPIALTALFQEGDVKSASWLQHLPLPMLAAYLGTTIWACVTLPRRRMVAIGCALINAPSCAFASLVVGMSASGTWL